MPPFREWGRLLPWNFRVNESSVPVTHSGRLQMDNDESLHQSAVAGLGIATLPSYVVNDDLRRGKLVQLLAGYGEFAEPIRVIYPSKRHLSPKIRLLIDKLVEAWSPMSAMGASFGRKYSCVCTLSEACVSGISGSCTS